MAAVDWRMPNVDDFVGLNWSCWVDRVDFEPSDAQSDDTKSGRHCFETMTLRKEDMPIYGHCPAQDDFYLVVCSHCGKLVKPQAFEEHCNRRHNICVPHCITQKQQPQSNRLSSNIPKASQRDSRTKEFSAPSSSSQRRTNKAQKEPVILQSVDKVAQDKSHPALPPRPRSQPVAPNLCQTSSSSTSVPSTSVSVSLSPVKPPVQKPTAAQTSNSPQRETKTYSRTQKNIKTSVPNKKSEYQDKKKLPIQTQNGKTESNLPTAPSSPRDSERSPAKNKTAESQGAPKETPLSCCNKFTLNTNSHIIRSKDVSDNFPEEESSVEVEVQPPYPFNHSLPPSDDSDDEEQCYDLPTTSWHPKPLGLCSFGCRAFGVSVYTFDRRLHHLRIALTAMLDNHVNSHLWKKMPQPASNFRSAHPTPSTRGSTAQHGTGPNQPGSFNVKSTSLDRFKNTSTNCMRTKSPPPIPTMTTLGQQCSSAGQAVKTQRGQRELMQNAKTAQKSMQLSHSPSSKYLVSSNVHVVGSLPKKTPPLSPLRPSERNTPFLNESQPLKPCPQRSKSRPAAIVQPRAGNCDDRPVVQKRKPQSTASPSSSSPSKKCPRLSPPSRSSLFSWKRDSTQDVWLGVWRQEHASEDDTSDQY